MKLPDKVVEGLVAGSFGLAGTLFTAGVSSLRDRSLAGQRVRQLDEAMKRLQFWEQWIKVATQLPQPIDGPCLQTVQQEMLLLVRILERSSHSMEMDIAQQKTETTALQEKLHNLPLWRRLLLLYWPARALAWLPRLFFYGGLLLAAFMLFALFDPDKGVSYTQLAVIEAFLLSGTMVFRFLSQSLEKPKFTHGPPPPPPRIAVQHIPGTAI